MEKNEPEIVHMEKISGMVKVQIERLKLNGPVLVCLWWNSLVRHAMIIGQLFTRKVSEVSQPTFLFSAKNLPKKKQKSKVNIGILFFLNLTVAGKYGRKACHNLFRCDFTRQWIYDYRRCRCFSICTWQEMPLYKGATNLGAYLTWEIRYKSDFKTSRIVYFSIGVLGEKRHILRLQLLPKIGHSKFCTSQTSVT